MKVLFSCYPTAFQSPAGGETQLLQTLEAVRRLGVTADRFDPWTTRIADYDVVHHFSFHSGGEDVLQYARSRGVGTALSTILWPDSEWWLPVADLRRVADLADLLLPNSRAEAERIGPVLQQAPERFHVVVNAVDPAWAAEPDPRPFFERFGGLLPGAPFALCAGRFDFRKNQLGLIRALKDSPVPLVLLGAAGHPDYLARCRSEAGPRTLFLDRLPGDGPLLRSAFAACGAFVMPSLAETPGLAVLEAAATGAPIVVTQEGSAREYLGRHARYVHPLASGEIRAAVEGAVREPRSMERRRHVLEGYTWDRAGRETVEAYRRILAHRAPAAPPPHELAFFARGFVAGPAIVGGERNEFQLRLGWGGLEEGGLVGRRLLGDRGDFYLRGSARGLTLHGWTGAPGILRVTVDGAPLPPFPLPGEVFEAAWDIGAGPREIREVSLSIDPAGLRFLLRRAALD